MREIHLTILTTLPKFFFSKKKQYLAQASLPIDFAELKKVKPGVTNHQPRVFNKKNFKKLKCD